MQETPSTKSSKWAGMHTHWDTEVRTLDSQHKHNELVDMQQWQGNEQMGIF
jgi:hypothetical protein